MSLTCYIIDDEPLALDVLESHIKTYGKLEIAGTFQNAVKAFRSIQDEPVDLLFLDIQMPQLTGLEMLRSLHDPPLIILTTAHREYAVEGFELDVVDYLLKPISFERFLKAMDKIAQLQSKDQNSPLMSSGDNSTIIVSSDQKKVRVKTGNILYVESQRNKVKIVTESRTVEAVQTLADMEKKLRPEGFIRIHRSFLVPLELIESWSATELEVNGESLPIGRTYKKEVLQLLD